MVSGFLNTYLWLWFDLSFQKGDLDESEIAKMKDKILSKYDANYDGRLDLEEVFSLLFAMKLYTPLVYI